MTNDDGKGGGNRSTVTGAFIESHSVLRRFLSRFFSDEHDVEDAAQEAFLRAYVAEQQRTIEQPRRYLFRIAKNVALSTLTRKSRQITEYLEESSPSTVVESDASAELELEARESFGLICEAVAKLPEKCRQVYLLRKVHGLSHKEIAERMSLTVSSVEKYLLRGVRETRAFVERREGHFPDQRPYQQRRKDR